MPRAAAFSSPSVTSRLRGLMSGWPGEPAESVEVVGLGDVVERWVMTGFYDPVHGLEPWSRCADSRRERRSPQNAT
jgi:hypothetical protein